MKEANKSNDTLYFKIEPLSDESNFVMCCSLEKGFETHMIEGQTTFKRTASFRTEKNQSVLSFANSPATSSAFLGCSNGDLVEVAPLDGFSLSKHKIFSTALISVHVAHEQKHQIFCGSYGGEVASFDRERQEVTKHGQHENRVIALIFLEGLVGSFGLDNQLKLWDLRQKGPVRSRFCITPQPNSITVFKDTLYYSSFQIDEGIVHATASELTSEQETLPKAIAYEKRI